MSRRPPQTTRFYASPNLCGAGQVALPPEEARHAVRVLRLRPGDEIEVVDGAGHLYHVRLDATGRDQAVGTVLGIQVDVGEPSVAVSIGMAVLKQGGRFETFLEKAVELGVGQVVPLLTERTEQANLKAARLEKIAVAAMKQCGRCRLPEITEPRRLPAVLAAGEHAQRLICHESLSAEDALGRVLDGAAASVQVLVGPEGGFTENEIGAARQAGYIPVSMGRRRLRAETAGIVAAAAVMLALDAGPR